MCRAADLPVTRHAGRPAPGYAGPMAGAYRATTPTPGSVVFVRRGLFREANRPGCAERDRWLFTVPCVAEFAEEGLTFQAVIFICRQPRVRQIYAPRSDRRGLQARLLRPSVGGERRSPERDEISIRPFADIGNYCGRISDARRTATSTEGLSCVRRWQFRGPRTWRGAGVLER